MALRHSVEEVWPTFWSFLANNIHRRHTRLQIARGYIPDRNPVTRRVAFGDVELFGL